MAINSFPPSGDGPIQIPDQLIDPVSKFRVSNPENLIDTDFEYGLQPTKWETVELINNTPSFFSKSGDTTIDGIFSIITNAGTREIIVKTELDHGLAVGIPINVTGTKSITADGAYIINSIPDTKTFTYLCKDNQTDTNSILDLYSSIITGEFFQGSQLRISDSDGIVTDAEGTSILTVTTNTTHGFGENTPFYFLNLNSTVAQEFQAANTASKSFDASNSATAQTFDGSNSLSSVNIDWSNSATFGGTTSTISGTDQAADTITVTHQAGENFDNLPLGTPLYYSVSATGGYFNTNPRGVVFLKTIDQLGTSTSTFQVSLLPDGDLIDLTSNLTGTFQIANQARTFAGNNINPLTQTVIDVEVGTTFNFDGGNQGYPGAVQDTPPNNTLTVLSYTTTAINADGASSVDYYVGAMVLYASTGTAATGLTTNTTYFVTSFTNNSGGNYTFSVAALPGGTPISISGGSGTQTFSRIGISVDKDIVHIKDSNFTKEDMIEYGFPVDGRFDVTAPEQEKIFYFVDTVYDAHNYRLSEDLGFKPVVATGGTVLPDIVSEGRTWRVHQFTTVGSTNFVVSDPGKEGLVEYLIVGGGGGGGFDAAGGGGGGFFRTGQFTVSATTYPIVVGGGGAAALTLGSQAGDGSSSSAFSITSTGGGGGGSKQAVGRPGANGGGGGHPAGFAGGVSNVAGGFAGGASNVIGGGGGGGASAAGANCSADQTSGTGGNGGAGLLSDISGLIRYYSGGGGGGNYAGAPAGGVGGLGGGGGGQGGLGQTAFPGTLAGAANTGGGGGSSGNASFNTIPGAGGSGIVIVRYPITPASPVATSATGGIETTTVVGDTTYRVHSFTTVGNSNFVVSFAGNLGPAEYLIVAGGGGGGGSFPNTTTGGGGGAGGLITGSLNLTSQTYPITVGAGGATTTGAAATNTNGGNSSAFGLTAIGGGRGGSWDAGGESLRRAFSGGSGGGQSDTSNSSLQSGGAGTSGQGFAGGNGPAYAGNTQMGAGGGGGAGGPGQSGTGTPSGGAGGLGRALSITGTSVVYAAGGGGGIGGGGAGGSGTAGVSGNGGTFRANGQAAPANRGGGGGGGGGNEVSDTGYSGGAGGSGIVIIRYPIAIAGL